MHTHLTCPSCGEEHYIQKVSAAYEEGQSTGQATGIDYSEPGHIISSNVTTRSTLSKRLQPPQKPAGQRAPARQTLFGLTILACGILVYWIIQNGYTVYSAQEWATRSLIPFLLICAVIVISLLIDRIGFRKLRQRQQARMEEINQRFLHDCDTWRLLYYCHRCDHVFLPDHQQAVTPEEITILYARR